jgi:hypothetical protein
VPGSWPHLASRFLDVAGARPLDLDEELVVRGWLRDAEVLPFFGQPPADQRHGLEAGKVVAESRPDRPDLIRAAALHDLAKRRAGLGLIGRSLASAWAKVGGRGKGRWAVYLDHGRLGAEELAGLGAEPIVIEFAQNHHGSRPASIRSDDWEVLVLADQGKAAERKGTGSGRR